MPPVSAGSGADGDEDCAGSMPAGDAATNVAAGKVTRRRCARAHTADVCKPLWGAAAERRSGAVRGQEVSAFGVAPRSLAWARYCRRQTGVRLQIARAFYSSSKPTELPPLEELAILAEGQPMTEPAVTDEDLVRAAEIIAARRGQAEADAFLQFWRRGLEVAKQYPLTDEEAMELANSELRAMRAERAQKLASFKR